MGDMRDMKPLVRKVEPYADQKAEMTFVAKVDGKEEVRYEGHAALFAIDEGDGEREVISGAAGKLSSLVVSDLLLAAAGAACSAAEAASGLAGRLLIAMAMRDWADKVLQEGRAVPKEPGSDDQ